MSSPAEMAFKSVFALVIALDVFGNTMIILVVLLNRTMQTPMNCLLTNLAIADLLVGIFFIPDKLLKGTYTHPGGWVGDLLCKTLTYSNLSWLVAATSVTTLMFIAWERYYAVLHPHSSRGRITKGKLRRFIASTWIFAVITASIDTWALRFDEQEQSCFYDWSDELRKTNIIWWSVAAGLVPISIQVGLYARVVHRLWGPKSQTTSTSQRCLMLQRKRLTKVVLTITICSVVCWLSYHLYYVLETFASDTPPANMGSWVPLLLSISHLLLLLNSTVNPIIYAAQDQKFRRFAWKVLTKGFRVQPEESATS